MLTPLCLCVAMSAAVVGADPEPSADAWLFREEFEDQHLPKRDWYDGERFKLSLTNPHSGKACLEYPWKAKTSTPEGSQGARRLFEPGPSVYLSFWMRLSPGWGWTGRNYHPHLMLFMTTENGVFDGPAASHLTMYVEPQAGRLRLAAQDIQNEKQPRGLTQGPLKGGYNGQMFDSEEVLFKDDEWHRVESYFQLNTLDLTLDHPRADGIARAWFDGEQVVDRTDVILRSTDFPEMQFNQFLMLPYFGPGLLPHAQTLWIDDLEVANTRPEKAVDETSKDNGQQRTNGN